MADYTWLTVQIMGPLDTIVTVDDEQKPFAKLLEDALDDCFTEWTPYQHMLEAQGEEAMGRYEDVRTVIEDLKAEHPAIEIAYTIVQAPKYEYLGWAIYQPVKGEPFEGACDGEGNIVVHEAAILKAVNEIAPKGVAVVRQEVRDAITTLFGSDVYKTFMAAECKACDQPLDHAYEPKGE